jgi:hypothetical protein
MYVQIIILVVTITLYTYYKKTLKEKVLGSENRRIYEI